MSLYLKTDFRAMMTSLVLSLCCCSLFLLTPAKSEPGRGQALTARKPNGKTGSLPFCPVDEKISKQVKAIRDILKKKTADKLAIVRQEKTRKTPMRIARDTAKNCEVCNYLSK